MAFVDKTFMFHDPRRALPRPHDPPTPAGYGHIVNPGRGWGEAVRHGAYPPLQGFGDGDCKRCNRGVPNPACHVCGFGEPAQHHVFAPLIREMKPIPPPDADAFARALGTSKLVLPETGAASQLGHFSQQISGRLEELMRLGAVPRRHSGVPSEV